MLDGQRAYRQHDARRLPGTRTERSEPSISSNGAAARRETISSEHGGVDHAARHHRINVLQAMNNKVWRACLCAFVCVFGFIAIAQSPTRLTGKLAYVQEGDIWVQILTEGTPHQMSQGGRADHPQWSASGHWLSFDQIKKVNVIPIEPIRQDRITLET